MTRRKCICRNSECSNESRTVRIYKDDKEIAYVDYCDNHIKKGMKKGFEFVVGVPMKAWGENTLRKLGLNSNSEIIITDVKG